MNKLVVSVVVFFMMVSLFGCGSQNNTSNTVDNTVGNNSTDTVNVPIQPDNSTNTTPSN